MWITITENWKQPGCEFLASKARFIRHQARVCNFCRRRHWIIIPTLYNHFTLISSYPHILISSYPHFDDQASEQPAQPQFQFVPGNQPAIRQQQASRWHVSFWHHHWHCWHRCYHRGLDELQLSCKSHRARRSHYLKVAFDNIVAIFLAITITDNQPISNLVTKATNINKKVIVQWYKFSMKTISIVRFQDPQIYQWVITFTLQ